jgi:hypothetical protein
MSAEQLPHSNNLHATYVEYAEQTWYSELVRRQNDADWTNDPLYLPIMFQKLYAQTMIEALRQRPYFQKFGGEVLNIVMAESEEPNMYHIGLTAVSKT